MRVHHHPRTGKQIGVETMTVEKFDEYFEEALKKFQESGGKLSELLITAAGNDQPLQDNAHIKSFKTWIEDGDLK